MARKRVITVPAAAAAAATSRSASHVIYSELFKVAM